MDKYYVGDFETCGNLKFKNYKLDKLNSEVWVWLWCVMDVYDVNKYKTGNNLKDFFDYCASLGFRGDIIHINFHNLKFDGSYILDYILRNNLFKKSNNDVNSKIKEGCYKTLIDGLGKWFTLTIKKNGVTVVFEDSLKKLPFSVCEIGKMLDLDEKKGEIDYDMFRGKDYIATEDEIDYVRRDCKIICESIRKMFLDNGYDRLTIGSNCMMEFKDIIKKKFKFYFKQLTEDEDNFVRKSYTGGLCMVGNYESYKGKITVIDKNSMYPSMMHSCSGNLYPVGEGIYFEGEYEYNKYRPLFVQHFKCNLKLKENHFGFVAYEHLQTLCQTYITNTNGKCIELWLNNVDFEILFEEYEVTDLEYIDGYSYCHIRGIFDEYINKWYNIKEESTKNGNKAMRLLSKLFLNNLYGKFGTNPIGTRTEYYLEEKLETEHILNLRKSIYVPVASFCTSYARRDLLNTANRLGGKKNVLYMDTDSIHVKDVDVKKYKIDLDKTKLNCWDIESNCDEGIYIRQKTYAEHSDVWTIKAAGCPDYCKKHINITEFKKGMRIGGKLQPVRVKGGTLLMETDFTIN